MLIFEDSFYRRQVEQSSNKAILSCPHRPKGPQRRRFPSNFQQPSSRHFSYRTSPCPSAAPSANSAIIASSTSSYGGCTPACNGRACPCPQTTTAQRKSMTPPSTKSSP